MACARQPDVSWWVAMSDAGRGKSRSDSHWAFVRAHPDRKVHDGGRIHKVEAVQARGVVSVQSQCYVLYGSNQPPELQANSVSSL